MKNRLLKTFTSLVLTVLMVISVMPAFAITIGAAEGDTYKLVRDVSALKSGDKVIIVATKSDVAMSTEQKTSNRGQVSITKNSDSIIYVQGLQEFTLENGTKTGTFAFKTNDGYIYAASSSSNNLKTKTTKDANGSWKIEITTAGIATITAQGTNTNNLLKYNSSSKLFSCYKSGQQDISIYKLVKDAEETTTEGGSGTDTPETPACEHINTVAIGETKAATCTEDGTTAGLKCSDCGTIIEEQTTISATGHTYANGSCTVCSAKIPTYVKVTSAPTDWSGEYLIVYEAGSVAFNGSLTTLDAESNTVEVTILDNKIAGNFSTKTFTIAKSDDNYIIKSASGYYIGQTTDANELKSSTSAEYANAISLNTDGTVNFVSGGAYLRFNYASNQLRFRYYSSTSYEKQKAITLYKLADDSGSGSESTIPETEPTIKSFSLSLNKGVTVKVKINIPANWSYVGNAEVVFSNGESFLAIEGERDYSVNLTPAQINDDLTVKIIDAEGKIWVVEKDVSVRAYRDKAEAAGASTQLIDLLDAALTYSSVADETYNGEDLTNDFNGVDYPTVVHADENNKLFTGFAGKLGTYASIYINVNTNIIEAGDTLSLLVGKANISGDISEYITKDGQIVITGLFPANFNDTIYIAALTEGSIAEFSFNSYLKAIYSSSSDKNIKNLAVATYLYGLAAEAYLATLK